MNAIQPAHPAAKIFSDVPIDHRQISTTTDRIHVRLMKENKILVAYRFQVEDVGILEAAIREAKQPSRTIRSVGTVERTNGNAIEIGAAASSITFRMRGSWNSLTISNGEIAALGMAIEQLRENATEAAKDTRITP